MEDRSRSTSKHQAWGERSNRGHTFVVSDCVRELPLRTSTNFSDFWPPPLLVYIRNWFVAKTNATSLSMSFFMTPSPLMRTSYLEAPLHDTTTVFWLLWCANFPEFPRHKFDMAAGRTSFPPLPWVSEFWSQYGRTALSQPTKYKVIHWVSPFRSWKAKSSC